MSPSRGSNLWDEGANLTGDALRVKVLSRLRNRLYDKISGLRVIIAIVHPAAIYLSGGYM